MCWGTLNRILGIYIITPSLVQLACFFIWNIHSTIYHRVLGDNSWRWRWSLTWNTWQETVVKFRILLVVVRGRSVRTNQNGVPCPALNYLILSQLQNKTWWAISLPGDIKKDKLSYGCNSKTEEKGKSFKLKLSLLNELLYLLASFDLRDTNWFHECSKKSVS